jgi:ethanolamine ammonia-lyase large subunit
MGLLIGYGICYTNHAEADQNDMNILLTLPGTAGVVSSWEFLARMTSC